MNKYVGIFILLLVSCNRSMDKDTFVKTALTEKFQKDSSELLSHSVVSENTVDEVTFLYFKAKIRKNSTVLIVKDSLLFTVTGDGFYVYQ